MSDGNKLEPGAVTTPDSTSSNAPVRLLRRPEVIKAVGLRRAAIYQLVREGRFPKPVKITTRSVGWIEAEIQAWLMERVKERATAQKGGFTMSGEQPVRTAQDTRPGYLVSDEEYRELQRLRRFERRIRNLLPGVRHSINPTVFGPGGEELNRPDDDD